MQAGRQQSTQQQCRGLKINRDITAAVSLQNETVCFGKKVLRQALKYFNCILFTRSFEGCWNKVPEKDPAASKVCLDNYFHNNSNY